MHARVTHLEGSLDRVEAGIKLIQETIIPQAKQIPGFQGGYWCMDRETGKGMAITLWGTLEALQASEEQVRQLREAAQEEVQAAPMQVDVYEVVGQA